jgi:hypothetical protein
MGLEGHRQEGKRFSQHGYVTPAERHIMFRNWPGRLFPQPPMPFVLVIYPVIGLAKNSHSLLGRMELLW